MKKSFSPMSGRSRSSAVKKSRRAKPLRSAGKRQGRGALVAPVEHVIAFDYEKTRPNVVKALSHWVGRATQPAARKAG